MNEVFDGDWLESREPVDERSRPPVALTMIKQAWQQNGWSRILDLGAGTGANVRYLSPLLPIPQKWTLIDHDEQLLTSGALPETAGVATKIVRNLNSGISKQIESTHADLVTASALLDLVSESWVNEVVDTCRAKRRGVYFSLTYDGSIQWHAAVNNMQLADDPDDAAVRQAVNAHQRRDKGFGPALGPMANLKAEAAFRAAGYQVWLLQSRWRLGPADSKLVNMLIRGWETAAVEHSESELRDGERDRFHLWAERRRETVAQREFGLTVGHLDLVALPGPG